tara:strand:+ start:34297 stop:34566 length:270 start_codon:yes stop_codon:yes gene_type:complete
MALNKTFTITNKQGLHARPAALFVKVANRYQSEIWVTKDGEEVNGKSIMGLMMLAAGHGEAVEVSIDGDDAAEAMAEIERLVIGGFTPN